LGHDGIVLRVRVAASIRELVSTDKLAGSRNVEWSQVSFR